MKEQIQLARTNGYFEWQRSALPTSATNESPVHNFMRRSCPAMRVCEVARALSQQMLVNCISADVARTFVVRADAGKSSYRSSMDQSFAAREAAINRARRWQAVLNTIGLQQH